MRPARSTEPFAVALHGLERGDASAGDDVAVLGFGPIGAAAAMIARAVGCRVHVVERDERRASVASQLGFALIDAGDGLPRRVRAALGNGGADVVVESTGSATLLPEAVDAARRGGRIVQLGMGGQPATVVTERLVLFERALIGSLGYRHHLPRIVRMVDERLTIPLFWSEPSFRWPRRGLRSVVWRRVWVGL